eukprot:Skav232860  [mRNA]  locus=scaffold2451:155034:156092:- [translate_table: standard]
MWWCHPCQFENPAESEFCTQCQCHWKNVWARKRRSRSQKVKKEPKDKTPKPLPTQEDEMTPWAIMPEKVPWIATTPQTRLQNRDAAGAAVPTNLPPDPVLPAPPVAPVADTPTTGLTTEENQVKNHLLGLIQAGMSLPESMMTQLQTLQAKEKETDTTRTLNHGHLSKLNRLRGQVQVAGQRVVELDHEWSNFVNIVSTRLQKHVEMYQACRQERMDTYHRRVQELAQAKKTVCDASQVLMDQIPAPEEVPPGPDPAVATRVFGEILATSSAVPLNPSLPGMEEDLPELEMESVEEIPSGEEDAAPTKNTSYRREVRLAPFQKAAVSTSPTKVANHHLKQREGQDSKGKKKS